MAWVSVALALVVAVGRPSNAWAGNPAPLKSPACSQIGPPGPIHFESQTLIDAPDLPPQLRLANALINANCFREADALWAQFASTHPDDFRVTFIRARLAWNTGQTPLAEAILDEVLRLHPGFLSAMVLRASMELDRHDYRDAQQLVDEVERKEPTNLWAFIDRLKLEAALAPSTTTVKTMRAILTDPDFPPIVQQTVLQIAEYGTTALPKKERDALFSAAMAGQPCESCALKQHAMEVIEGRRQPGVGAEEIESYLRKCGSCVATADVRVLLAEAYLMEAAAIAPKQIPANARLVREAKQALGGDLTPLAFRVAGRGLILDPILPFLKGSVNHDAVDQNGNTIICSAIYSLSPALVQEELDSGVNPNGHCGYTSLLMTLLHIAAPPNEQVYERRAIAESLLLSGARVEGMGMCADKGNGDCSTVLLPILKQFQAARARATRTL